jgi:hypothetical protein
MPAAPAPAPEPAPAPAPVSLLPAFVVPGSQRPRIDSEAPVAAPVAPPAQPTRARLKSASRAAIVAGLAMALGALVRWSAFGAPPERRAAAGPQAPSASATRAPQGVLEITLPEDTTVVVDGAPRGQGPRVTVSLPEGTHEVKTAGADASFKPRTVEIARGRITHVDLSPKLTAVPPATGAPATSAPRPPR